MSSAQIFAHLVLLAVCTTVGVTGADPSPAEHCPAIRIDPVAGSAADRALVCDGAALARRFFREHGIPVRQSIRIRLAREPIDIDGQHIGTYDARRKQIDLLALEQARAKNTDAYLFKTPMDEALYRSVVVHEVAHAIADQHFKVRPARLVAHEYIAYVAQLSTMEPTLRERILRSYDLPPYKDVDEMSAVFYALEPAGFGVKAYRHYLSLPDPSRFLHDLLSGAVLPRRSNADW